MNKKFEVNKVSKFKSAYKYVFIRLNIFYFTKNVLFLILWNIGFKPYFETKSSN